MISKNKLFYVLGPLTFEHLIFIKEHILFQIDEKNRMIYEKKPERRIFFKNK